MQSPDYQEDGYGEWAMTFGKELGGKQLSRDRRKWVNKQLQKQEKQEVNSLWRKAELFFLDLNFTPLIHPSFSTPSCPLLAAIIALNHTCWWHSQTWQLGRFSFCEIILQTFGCLSKEPQQESGIIWLGVKHPGPEPGSFGWIRLQNLEKNAEFFHYSKWM